MSDKLRASRPSRRDLLRTGSLALAGVLAGSSALAQQRRPAGQLSGQAEASQAPPRITIDEANIRPRPIAIPDLLGE